MHDPLPSYKEIAFSFSDYGFDCPVGAWRARLDCKAWGKKRNILLFFTEVGTDKSYCACVFNETYHQPESGGIDFRDSGKPGQLFELETGKTKSGRSKLISARIIASPEEEKPSADTRTAAALVPVP
jgi:hypothetical protein